MSRINHILKELFRNIYRNPGTAIGAVLSMMLLFLLFDIFWIAADTSEKFYKDLLLELNMEVFIAENISDSTLAGIREKVIISEGVNSIKYISKERAREQLSEIVGIDLLVGYDSTNPLPRSYVISFDAEYLNAENLSVFEKKIVSIKGVSHVYYSKNWLEKAEKTRGIILNVGMMLGSLILLTVLFNSANNLRLTARTSAIGFHQMRLLGCGKLFLAFPFLLQGFLISGLSAAVGWLIIFYWKDRIDFTRLVIVFPTVEEITIYCSLAALLGGVSGYLGIRKLLKL
ncbi:MAG: cell division protein FtsX [Candidatus Zixiibacteriota bacterium]